MRPPNGQEEAQLRFDDRKDSYEGFFDHEWARRLLDSTEGTRLYEPFFDLCTDWKGVSNTFRMPWLMMLSLQSLADGFAETHEPFWRKLAKAFAQYLLTQNGVGLSNMKKKQLMAVIERLGQQVQDKIRHEPPPFQLAEIWAGFVKSTEFVLSLWSSQRLCHSGLYHAYENFLRRCVSIAKQESEYRSHRAQELQEDLNTSIAKGLGDECLGDPEVAMARLVRNALAHNGARATQELAGQAHGLAIQDGVIQIMPNDVRQLFGLLKGKVCTLVAKAGTTPQFQRKS